MPLLKFTVSEFERILRYAPVYLESCDSDAIAYNKLLGALTGGFSARQKCYVTSFEEHSSEYLILSDIFYDELEQMRLDGIARLFYDSSELTKRQRLDTLEKAITEELLICPSPIYWDKAYRNLARRLRGRADVPVPLILGAWHVATDADKSKRLKTQLKIASDFGLRELFLADLLNTPADCWIKGPPAFYVRRSYAERRSDAKLADRQTDIQRFIESQNDGTQDLVSRLPNAIKTGDLEEVKRITGQLTDYSGVIEMIGKPSDYARMNKRKAVARYLRSQNL